MARRLLKLTEAAQYAGIGRTKAFFWLAQIGARVEISKRCIRYDTAVIDAEIEKLRKAKESA